MPADPQYIWLDAPTGGHVVFGTNYINFGGGKVMIAEDIEYRKPMRSVDFVDENGKIQAAAYASAKGSGSMTLQLNTLSDTVVPGEAFSFAYAFAGGTGNMIACIVIGVSPRFQIMDLAKIVVEFVEYINPPGGVGGAGA